MLSTVEAIGAILLCHVLCASGGTQCRGGGSLRGVSSPDELHSRVEPDGGGLRTASCCDDDVRCHGGYLLAEHHFGKQSDRLAKASHRVPELIEPMLSHYAQGINRKSRSIEQHDDGGRPQCAKDEGCLLALREMRCCSANVSVFFPISAISALTGEAVHVIQAPPLVLQAVMFGRCETDKSHLLDADCQQDFVAEMMYVAKLNATTQEIRTHREPVLVESGCSCRMNQEPLKVADGPSVDDALAMLLTMW